MLDSPTGEHMLIQEGREGREGGTRRVSKDVEEGRKEYGIFKGDARVEGRERENVAE